MTEEQKEDIAFKLVEIVKNHMYPGETWELATGDDDLHTTLDVLNYTSQMIDDSVEDDNNFEWLFDYLTDYMMDGDKEAANLYNFVALNI